MRKILFLGIFMLLSWGNLCAQVVINEVCATNGDINYDPQFYNFSGWIELHNKGNSAVNVGGYFLSNNPSNKFIWQIPGGTSIGAKGYLLIWCDEKYTGLHTNFKLDADGEKLILSSTSSALVDSLTFPSQYINISYGRVTDGAANRGYLSKVTPTGANSYDNATEVLADVTFSKEAGRYSGSQALTLSHPASGVAIRYTLNGAEPTISSTLYSASISVNKTMTVKAKAFKTGMLPGNTVSKTYFINEHVFTLPVVSLSMNPAYLSDNTIGIYVSGTNGIAGNCNDSPVNWNQDWSRHAVFEYYMKNGSKKFDQSLDIRIGGACSRNMPQKTFAVKARDEYGNNSVDHQLFPSKDIYKYGSFFLNNSGNDFNVTMFRDALLQSLVVGEMDIDYMAYQPSVLYLNGAYWGIQNLREKIDGDYIEANFNIDKDDVDLIETYENAIEGTNVAYLSYKDSLQRIDLNDPASFAFIDKHIDVQEYINYLVTEIYYANTDWPGNNIKFWRQRSTNGKFRWILWDLDFGFGLYSDRSYSTHPTLYFATDPDETQWPNPGWSTLHIRLVLQNPIFRSRFIQTMLTAINTTFKPTRVIDVIDSFQSQISAEMPYHKQRWGGTISNWNNEVQRMREFAAERNPYMIEHTADFFGLSEKIKITVEANPPNASSFNFNGVTTDQVDVTYFKGIPYDLKPVAKRGFEFKEWKITERESTPVLMIPKGDTWKYFDQGSLPAANWQAENFSDGTWQQGAAEFGYGDGDEQTVISYGPDAGNKYITTYFRKTFTVADTVGLGDLSASIRIDDGVIVYLNGVEVYRNNMPAGTSTYSTLALQAIASETAFSPFSIAKGLIKPGQNSIAVEVHQNVVTSSDVSFDFSLSGVLTGTEVQITSTIPVLADTAYSDILIEAMFNEVPVKNYNIVINEFNATRSGAQDEFGETEDWIELFNAGTEEVNLDGLYLTDNFSNKTKFRITESIAGEMVLAPGAYKVFFADEQIEQGSSHLNFKLSADGEQIGLYYEEGKSLLMYDTTLFGLQKEDYSLARIPNGSGPFKETIAMTPGSENIFKENTPLTIGVYPNPIDRYLTIVSEEEISAVAIYDLMGKLVQQFNIQSPAKSFDLDAGEFSPGLYVLKVGSGSRLASSKIIKQ
jgi:hypothetical protein